MGFESINYTKLDVKKIKDLIANKKILENKTVVLARTKNPKTVYKISKLYENPNFNLTRDEFLLKDLLEKQQFVYKTEFPKGIVTCENRVVGQEIPFYKHYHDMERYFEMNAKEKLHIKKQIIEIIKELYDNDIVYTDVHQGNFLISPILSKVRLIDFDGYITYVTKNKEEYLGRILLFMKQMFSYLDYTDKRILEYKSVNYHSFEKIEEDFIKKLK